MLWSSILKLSNGGPFCAMPLKIQHLAGVASPSIPVRTIALQQHQQVHPLSNCCACPVRCRNVHSLYLVGAKQDSEQTFPWLLQQYSISLQTSNRTVTHCLNGLGNHGMLETESLDAGCITFQEWWPNSLCEWFHKLQYTYIKIAWLLDHADSC